MFDTRQNLYGLTLFTVHSNLSYDNAGVRPPFRFMYYHIRKMYTFANKGRSRPRFFTKVVLSGDRKKKGLLQTIKLTIGKRRGRACNKNNFLFRIFIILGHKTWGRISLYINPPTKTPWTLTSLLKILVTINPRIG